MRSYFTYILASARRGTLYVGVTNGLLRRVEQHRSGTGSAFTTRYRIHRLVWFQEFALIGEAIQREKTIKEWPRDWKLNLIERDNPRWQDLYPTLPGAPDGSLDG
ncbi:MAG: GIY-YIG nuclease family protein [Hyphomicrobiales bacterium]|nr:MAG: GIY-YIG nuclease family protein [Hyphomicrobiales bacterium]